MKRIPVALAKQIANKYGYEKVVIFAITKDEPKERYMFWVTTYGKTKALCEVAAKTGQYFVKMCNHPTRFKDITGTLVEVLKEVLTK